MQPAAARCPPLLIVILVMLAVAPVPASGQEAPSPFDDLTFEQFHICVTGTINLRPARDAGPKISSDLLKAASFVRRDR